jgi:hypothetical protein
MNDLIQTKTDGSKAENLTFWGYAYKFQDKQGLTFGDAYRLEKRVMNLCRENGLTTGIADVHFGSLCTYPESMLKQALTEFFGKPLECEMSKTQRNDVFTVPDYALIHDVWIIDDLLELERRAMDVCRENGFKTQTYIDADFGVVRTLSEYMNGTHFDFMRAYPERVLKQVFTEFYSVLYLETIEKKNKEKTLEQ